MKTVWAIIFCILVCAACQRGKNETSELKIFQCPVIVNNSNGGAVIKGEFESNEIAAVYPLRFGKYKFTDTIYYSNCTSEVPVTDLREEGEIYRAMDTFDTNGFELIVDYEQTFYLPARHHFQDTLVYPYYPVYFVNSGPNDKLLLGKDSHVFGIQEAENKFNSDRWQPIEYRGYDFCGNGVWGVIVHPGEFYMVLMKKYKGEIKTELRVRFSMHESIYTSKPFIGFVNPEQFSMPDNSIVLRSMRESNGAASQWLFYGANPDYRQWNFGLD